MDVSEPVGLNRSAILAVIPPWQYVGLGSSAARDHGAAGLVLIFHRQPISAPEAVVTCNITDMKKCNLICYERTARPHSHRSHLKAAAQWLIWEK
jgi:hypothetical protein